MGQQITPYIIFIFLLAGNPCFSQGENNIWYFGNNAGIDFNSGSPVSISGGQVNTIEGSAGICNAAGQLLFYSDGTFVWDRNHNIMPNGSGLFGDGSSTQSAVICADPAGPSLYYIFTADQGGYAGPNQGINYSKIDMTLNAGLGDVYVLNSPLLAPEATEKIVAVQHCNGADYWIVVHPFNSNAFHAYQVTAAGVNTTPVISNVGTVHSNSGGYGETIGYMKASPDGGRLAVANYGQGFVDYFDFDNTTGIVSNPGTILYLIQPAVGPYGVSFSPDNTKLYVGFFNYLLGPSYLYQYDLLAGNAAAIAASQFAVGTDINGMTPFSAVQIGPDNKIYVARFDGTSIDVVNNPNVLGPGCNFAAGAVPLAAGTMSKGGLPNIVDAVQSVSGYLNLGPDTSYCGNFSHLIDASALTGTYLWNTGATTSSITVTQPGTYYVSVLTGPCSIAITDTIVISSVSPSVSLGPDTTICSAAVTLDPNAGAVNYLWSTGAISPAISVTQNGAYWVLISSGNCTAGDTINVTFKSDANFSEVNVFTPNGDGVNDHFTPGTFPPAGYSLAIYDRWGILVFQTMNPALSWDGTFEGKPVPDGVCFWLLTYTDCTGKAAEANGFVH
ncbi:MAG TPA: gliding motility-associated C-terminal domain-containing protein, partial [Bacteroidia bacterium]|nr:gliding motility-associated C-terminal domain-containing protein [Bacteroidia bacterium]